MRFCVLAALIGTLTFPEFALHVAADEPAKKSKADWDKWRKDVQDRIAKGKKEAEKRRASFAGADVVSSSVPARTMPNTKMAPPIDLKSRVGAQVDRPARGELRYDLKVGKQFAYRVEVVLEDTGAAVRYSGEVFFDVKSANPMEDAQLHAIGRLRKWIQSDGDKWTATDPDNDIWIGSFVKVNANAEHVGGRGDYNLDALPPALHQLLPLKRLFFVELPYAAGEHIGHSKSGHFIDTETGALGAASIKMIAGREEFRVDAGAAVGSMVPIHRTKAVYATEGDRRSYRYDGKSRFDKRSGLLLETDATAIFESAGSVERKVRFVVRPLLGTEFDMAGDNASKTMRQRPAKQFPAELLRERVEVSAVHPPWLRSTDGLKAGTMVAHFREGDLSSSDSQLKDFDYKFYRAKVMGVSDLDGSLKIQYVGSKEEFHCKPIRLVLMSQVAVNP